MQGWLPTDTASAVPPHSQASAPIPRLFNPAAARDPTPCPPGSDWCRTFIALAMSDELRLDYKMQPGDMALVNNLTMLHAKTAFKVGGICPMESARSSYYCPSSIHPPAPATAPFDPSPPLPPPPALRTSLTPLRRATCCACGSPHPTGLSCRRTAPTCPPGAAWRSETGAGKCAGYWWVMYVHLVVWYGILHPY